jgi:flagellar motor switch protein FliM
VHRSTTTENFNILKDKLSTVDVNIVAEIGKINIPIREVLSLRTGDVVQLYNTRVGDPYSLIVGNRKKFLCRPGVIGKKMAVQVIKKIAELEREEFEDLASDGEDLL